MTSLLAARPATDLAHAWHGGAMARRPGTRGEPRAYVVAGGSWPEGPFAADTPPEVRYAAAVASGLRAGLVELGLPNTTAAIRMGLARPSLQRILAGHVMPDLRSLAAAEVLLGRRLTPDPARLLPSPRTRES